MAGRTGRVMSERWKASLISWYPPPQSRNDKWKVWLKSLGILIDAVTRHPRNLAALPRKFFFLWQYDIKRIGEAFWKRSDARVVGVSNAPRLRCTLHLCRCWKDAETASPLRLGVRNIHRAGTTDLQMLRPLAPNISRQGVNTWSLAYPSPPFPAIPSLVNGQEWCLPFLF